ncbi:MAG: hypothetical protein WDW36_002317 [Sanguina aurantia]
MGGGIWREDASSGRMQAAGGCKQREDASSRREGASSAAGVGQGRPGGEAGGGRASLLVAEMGQQQSRCAQARAELEGQMEEGLRQSRAIKALQRQLAEQSAASSEAVAAASLLTSSLTISTAEHSSILTERLAAQHADMQRHLSILVSEISTRFGAPEGELRSSFQRHMVQNHRQQQQRQRQRRPHRGGGRGEAEAVQRMLRLNERLSNESAAAGTATRAAQHSMQIARASWAPLRQLLASLHGVLTGEERGLEPGIVRGSELLQRLLCEWEPSATAASLDLAIERSLAAGAALLEDVLARWQSHSRTSTASKQQAAADASALLLTRHAHGRALQEADAQVKQALERVDELQGELCRSQAAATEAHSRHCLDSSEKDRLVSALTSAQAAHQAVSEALAASEGERGRAQQMLAVVQGGKVDGHLIYLFTSKKASQGEVESLVAGKEQELARLRHTVGDLQATVALLHGRLEQREGPGQEDLESLKSKLRDVLSAVSAPSLRQLHHLMSPTRGGSGGGGGGGGNGRPDGGGRMLGDSGGDEGRGEGRGRGMQQQQQLQLHRGRDRDRDREVQHSSGAARRGLSGALSGGLAEETDSLLGLRNRDANGRSQRQDGAGEWEKGGGAGSGGDGDGDGYDRGDDGQRGRDRGRGGDAGGRTGGVPAGWDAGHRVAVSLEKAVSEASGGVSSLLHQLALLEITHWELERGLGVVLQVKQHLHSLAKELKAGRFAVGEVVVHELISLLDPPASSAAAPPLRRQQQHHHQHQQHSSSQFSPGGSHQPNGGGGGSGHLDMVALQSQVSEARQMSSTMTLHAKSCEGLLLSLQNALPGWLELTAASSQAAHRTELSRLKALLSAKLGGLRDELQALKDSSKAELAAAAGRAAETLQAAGALFSRQLASLASAGEEMVQQQLQLQQQQQQQSGGVDENTAIFRFSPTRSQLAQEPCGTNIQRALGAGHGEPEGARLLQSVRQVGGVLGSHKADLAHSRQDNRRLAGLLEACSQQLYGGGAAAELCKTLQPLFSLLPFLSQLHRVVTTTAGVMALPAANVEGLLDSEPGVFNYNVLLLRDLLTAALQRRELGAAEATAALLTKEQASRGSPRRRPHLAVLPLQQHNQMLSQMVEVAQSDAGRLRGQVSTYVSTSQAALAAGRAEAGQVSAAALEGVMGALRGEVEGMQRHLRELQRSSSSGARQVDDAWATVVDEARGAGLAAVASLEGSATQLQSQLGVEVDSLEALRSELDAALKDHAMRQTSTGSQLSLASAELADSQQLVTAREGEVAELKAALRHRDSMVRDVARSKPGGIEGVEARRHERLEAKLQERLAKRKHPGGAEGGTAQVAQQAAQERVEQRLKAEYSSDRSKTRRGGVRSHQSQAATPNSTRRARRGGAHRMLKMRRYEGLEGRWKGG